MVSQQICRKPSCQNIVEEGSSRCLTCAEANREKNRRRKERKKMFDELTARRGQGSGKYRKNLDLSKAHKSLPTIGEPVSDENFKRMTKNMQTTRDPSGVLSVWLRLSPEQRSEVDRAAHGLCYTRLYAEFEPALRKQIEKLEQG